MGSGKKKKQPAPPHPDDDDALLAAAIAENAAVREAEAKMQPQRPTIVLTLQQSLAKLDRVHTFHVVTVLANGMKDAFPSTDGVLTFYTDAEDAKEALEELQAKQPEAALRLELVPLGRAFAVTQGLMGLAAPIPTRLQFSRAVVAAEGEGGLPAELRERMRKAGPFPLFVSQELSTDAITPVFLTRDDLADAWCKRGKPLEQLDVVVTDLRTLVARTMQEPQEWNSLVYVEPKRSAASVMTIGARAAKQQQLAQGLMKGDALLKQVAHQVAVADGDEPPPLL